MKVECIRGDQNPADVFTKSLSRAEILRHCEALGCHAVDTAGSDDAPLDIKNLDNANASWTTVTKRMRQRRQYG